MEVKKIKEGRYTYIIARNKITCISSFAGRKVKGVSVCSEEDTFDEEFGKNLARAKCDLKVAQKRLKRSEYLLDEAIYYKNYYDYYVNKYLCYNTDAQDEYDDCVNNLHEMLVKESSTNEKC